MSFDSENNVPTMEFGGSDIYGNATSNGGNLALTLTWSRTLLKRKRWLPMRSLFGFMVRNASMKPRLNESLIFDGALVASILTSTHVEHSLGS